MFTLIAARQAIEIVDRRRGAKTAVRFAAKGGGGLFARIAQAHEISVLGEDVDGSRASAAGSAARECLRLVEVCVLPGLLLRYAELGIERSGLLEFSGGFFFFS